MKVFLLFSWMMVAFAGAQGRTTNQDVKVFANVLGSQDPELFFLKRRGTYEEVELKGTNFSEAVKVMSVGGAIEVFGKSAGESAGRASYASLGKVATNPSWKDVYCILLLNGSSAGGGAQGDARKTSVSGLTFEDSKKSFPEGSIKLVNLSEKNLKGEFGKASFTLAGRQVATVELEDKSGEVISALIQFEDQARDQWFRLLSTRWTVDDDKRVVIVVFPNPRGGGLRTKTIPILDRR